jgi:mannose/cellobiose epimerase-like protein (N-acyl-D-glucosamine 2-epimerase family)
MTTELPDFRRPATLVAHIAHTLAFYHPRCVDPSGGFYHYFLDDGTVYDAHTRHLVSSARFVYNYAMAARRFGHPAYLEQTRHGLAFLQQAHHDPLTGGYAWLLDWRAGRAHVRDGTNHAYGLAFVVLACAHALMAGVTEARAPLEQTIALMEQRFWEPRHDLYADEASADWSTLAPYRGQNANMHACEALLAAFDATGNRRWLDRAAMLAHAVTVRLAARTGGMVWEHYTADWQADWDYNRHDPANLFRPWGYQPGHLAEWAKLLLLLERRAAHLDTSSMLPRARQLFASATALAWDGRHGGLHYGIAPDGQVCDAHKYFWVQAESIAAAALLAGRTGDAWYWDWYERLWRYSWKHFVDHAHGAWYRILGPDNARLTNEKSPAGKTDYHTMGACYDVLTVLEGNSRCPSC